MVAGARQLKVGLRVRDLDRSTDLYRRVGFRQLPNAEQPMLRYLTFGHTWLILSSLDLHGYHDPERERAVKSGPLGSGFVLVVPSTDIAAVHQLWVSEGLTVTLPPEDVGFADIFYGLDPDGYEIMFEQFRG
ncbi:VOC family protein [Nocardioides okcheonensis]|uniref:VOC family protein n=1 Tax=Nocardioides okcheonensis TaxID=2894081 RepID=UPI001E52E89F|nr:VOC family protein [Nocardioides okcheonensis]UFN44661.1 VOC family protein [Nocardioides okcheonensis]